MNGPFDISGGFEWFQGQIKILIYIVLTIILAGMIWKRAWIMMVLYLLGVSVAMIFILRPEIIESIAKSVQNLVEIGS
ncbi:MULTISPECIES: hypothetical protein [Bacillus]|uniref:hypothetical protein n=1 Tax=Bacillus TaxID=1386 RepID=UPI0009349A72|nr:MULTISPECIES: hypothetical protein [Bacillus]MCY7576695.1 hypothetical protein [Bacillus pumilus]OJT56879.1 hypothetical protein BFP49_22560 [Bacillus licheniformis]TKD54543.1 hypothetical protein FBF75_19260 [Bacillus sp. S2(2019)]